VLQGKVPTTPTSASIVAAFQTQEALKLLHSLEVRPGAALMINGLTNDIYVTEYPVKEDCLSHARREPIIELAEATTTGTTVGQLLAIARQRLGPAAVLEFDSEIVTTMSCPSCGQVEAIFKRMARLYEGEYACPNCGSRREMSLTHRISGEEDYLDRPLAGLDVPPLAIIRARNGSQREHLELTGDKESFLAFS
jgi:adenylyltransferase/sulfurtransferase